MLTNETQIITANPDLHELPPVLPTRQYTHEPVPTTLLWSGFDRAPDPTKAPMQVMLTNLRNELLFMPPTGHDQLVDKAYSLARTLGDDAVQHTGREGQRAFGYIDAMRSVRHGTTFLGVSDKGGEGHVSAYPESLERSQELDLAVNVADFRKDGRVLNKVRRRVQEAGIDVEPVDVAFLSFMGVAGHEAGHLIEQSAKYSLPYNFAGRTDHGGGVASEYTLLQNPDWAVTGDLPTDRHILSERFAEGYGLVVVAEAARVLGYDDATITQLQACIGFGEEASHPQASVLMKQGYAQPLTLDQIAHELSGLADIAQQRLPRDQSYVDQELYSAAIAALPEPPTGMRPESVDTPVRKSLLARAIASLGMARR